MKKIICFDLDDTLIDDNYKFEITFCDCIGVIIKALETRSPQIDTILQTAREIDNKSWETLPKEERYMPRRVATSWMQAYEKLAKENNIPVRRHVTRLLWSLVMTNYDPPYYVIPGVIEVLKELKDDGFELHVITVGHINIQMRKLKVSGLIKYFDKQHVEKSDKEPILRKIADKYGKENVVMIGNSMRSDINPALNVSVKAIYIPRGNWHRFKADPINNNYVEIKNITEVPKNI